MTPGTIWNSLSHYFVSIHIIVFYRHKTGLTDSLKPSQRLAILGISLNSFTIIPRKKSSERSCIISLPSQWQIHSRCIKLIEYQISGFEFTISSRHLTMSCFVTGIGLLSRCPLSGMMTSAASSRSDLSLS